MTENTTEYVSCYFKIVVPRTCEPYQQITCHESRVIMTTCYDIICQYTTRAGTAQLQQTVPGVVPSKFRITAECNRLLWWFGNTTGICFG